MTFKYIFPPFLALSFLFSPFISSCSHVKTESKEADNVEMSDSAQLHQYFEYLQARYANPNSPDRDEDILIDGLESLLSNPALGYADSLRAQSLLEAAMKNRPGTIAADFRYQTPDGAIHRMHELKAQQLLLAFYDPECPHCSEILQTLDNVDTQRLIACDSLTVLAVYTEGNDSVWRASVGEMPRHWIVGMDRDSIVDREIYDLPAMPIVYLLDSAKNVVIKDMVF